MQSNQLPFALSLDERQIKEKVKLGIYHRPLAGVRQFRPFKKGPQIVVLWRFTTRNADWPGHSTERVQLPYCTSERERRKIAVGNIMDATQAKNLDVTIKSGYTPPKWCIGTANKTIRSSYCSSLRYHVGNRSVWAFTRDCPILSVW